MTLIRLFAIGKILGIELVPSDEVKISPHKFIMQEWGFYLEGVWLWRISGNWSQGMMGLVLI